MPSKYGQKYQPFTGIGRRLEDEGYEPTSGEGDVKVVAGYEPTSGEDDILTVCKANIECLVDQVAACLQKMAEHQYTPQCECIGALQTMHNRVVLGAACVDRYLQVLGGSPDDDAANVAHALDDVDELTEEWQKLRRSIQLGTKRQCVVIPDDD